MTATSTDWNQGWRREDDVDDDGESDGSSDDEGICTTVHTINHSD